MTTTPDRPVADQPLIDEVVESLRLLVDEEQFAQTLADSIMSPVKTKMDAAVVAAFRDDRLINRSVIAANYLIARANNDMKKKKAPPGEDPREVERRRLAYIDMVGRERQILKDILKGIKARKGILDMSPNPRARAAERLVSLNMRADIPKGMFAQLVEEEEEKVRAQKRRLKQEAAARKREAKAAERGDARARSPRQGESTRAFTDSDVSAARARQGGGARTTPAPRARANR